MIKEAKIFEAGEFPDKNLSVTEKDLDQYINNFIPCPLKIEHTETPFDGILGTLESVYKKGKELFGKINFLEEAWSLIEKTGAKSLSVCLNPNLFKIEEVSLVKHPRIKDARIFCFNTNILKEPTMEEIEKLKSENQQLKSQIAENEAEKIAEKYLDKGILTPANFSFAKEILKCDFTVKFNDDEKSLKTIFIDFLENSPVQVDFSQTKREIKENEEEFSQGALDFAKKLGVKLGGRK